MERPSRYRTISLRDSLLPSIRYIFPLWNSLDCASSEFHKGNIYLMEGKRLSRKEMVRYLEGLSMDYPIVSIEDGLSEQDWEGWKLLTEKLGKRVQLVGDGLFVTNSDRLGAGIEKS